MSFKSFSTAQSIPAKDKSDDKVKAAPADAEPTAKTDKTATDSAVPSKT